MPLLVRIAWRNVWRQRRRTLITSGAMAVGVACSIAMIAFSDGIYAQAFEQMVTEGIGHVQVHNPAFPGERALGDVIEDGDGLAQKIAKLPDARAVSARVFGYALVSVDDLPGRPQRSAGAQLIGVVPADEARLSRLDDKITEGRYLSPGPRHEIILGSGLAESLHARLGEKVAAVTQAADGSLGNDLYEVVGVFKSGNVITDRGAAYMHIDDARDLLVLGSAVHEIAVNGASADSVDKLVAEVNGAASSYALAHPEEPKLLVRSWRQVSPLIAQMLSIQDLGNGLLLLIVFSVAALGILNTMLMSVFERARELGVLLALGLTPLRLVALVVLETLVLVGVAGVVGAALGLGADAYLVHHGLDLTGVIGDWSFGGASFPPVLKGAFRIEGVVETLAGLLIVSLLASIWPAIRAARLQPVAAMRQH